MENILTEQQAEVLVYMSLQIKPLSEDDICKIAEWAEETLIRKGLLELILSGMVAPTVTDGEIVFARLENRINTSALGAILK